MMKTYLCIVFVLLASCKSRSLKNQEGSHVKDSKVYMLDEPLSLPLSELKSGALLKTQNVEKWVVGRLKSSQKIFVLAKMKDQSKKALPLYLAGKDGVKNTRVDRVDSVPRKISTPDRVYRTSPVSDDNSRIQEKASHIKESLKSYENIFAFEDPNLSGGRGYIKKRFSSDVELARVLAAFSIRASQPFGFDVATTSNLGGLKDSSQNAPLSAGAILQRFQEKDNYSILVQIPERAHWVGIHKSKDELYVFDSLGSSQRTLEVGYGLKLPDIKLKEASAAAKELSLYGRSPSDVDIEGVSRGQMAVLIRQWNFKNFIESASAGKKLNWIQKPHQTEDGWKCGYHQLEAAYQNSQGAKIDLENSNQDSRFLNDFIGPGKSYEQLAHAVEVMRQLPPERVVERSEGSERIEGSQDSDISELSQSPSSFSNISTDSPGRASSDKVWEDFGKQVRNFGVKSPTKANSWGLELTFFAFVVGGGTSAYIMTRPWFDIDGSSNEEILKEKSDIAGEYVYVERDEEGLKAFSPTVRVAGRGSLVGNLNNGE